MDSFFRSQTLLENRFSSWRRGGPFSRNLLVVALTVVLLGFSANSFCSNPSSLAMRLSPELTSLLGWQRRAGTSQSTASMQNSFIFPQSPLLRR